MKEDTKNQVLNVGAEHTPAQQRDAETFHMSGSLIDSIINQSPYPMWISDNKGTLIRINQACMNLLSISENEVVGRYNILDDVIVKEQGFLPLVRGVFERGGTARFEIRYDSSELKSLQLKNHAFVILDVTVFPIKDAQENITNAVIQHIDVTECRQAEEALQLANAELEARVQLRTAELTRTNETLQTLCASAPIGIFKTDDNGSCIYSNSQVQEIFGLTAEECLGLGWTVAIHPDDRAETCSTWAATTVAGGAFQHEYRLISKGKTRWVRGLARPVKEQGGIITGYVGTLEDITEQRHAQDEILKVQRLESLGLLAGGIAHDFNNILTVILGYVSLARSAANDPHTLLSRLHDGERAVMRARDLTQQLITFARGGDPIKKTVSLNDLLREAADFGQHVSNITCDFILAEDLLPISADEGQLNQVVHNLVLNALQAMPEGGRIMISSENIESPQEDEAMVKFSVSDVGIGISDHHQPRIFDPFFTTKPQGSGLGLANCYSIVKKHKGTITVDSELGRGSSFTVSLPALRQQSLPERATQAAESHGFGRILFVDDDPLIREVGQAMLEQLGYCPECVMDGGKAVELCRKRKEEGEPYVAVIMDLTIPGGIGGKEAISLIRSFDPDVKAVVSSGYSGDPVMANHRSYGFDSVLEKPYSQCDMSQVLHELLKKAVRREDR